MRNPSRPTSRVGEQLMLDLEEHPWGGRSPRSLCKVNLNRTIGGTGRAHHSESKALELTPERSEDLQLWLFTDDRIS